MMPARKLVLLVLAGVLTVLALGPGAGAASAAPCDAPIVSPVACENTKVGNPPSEWDVAGGGSTNIQGYTTDISTNVGGVVTFKVDTSATAYRIDIYRLGYYGGNGANKVTTVRPLVALPQLQPACANDNATTKTGLVDCGNWSTSATWTVPATAVSGLYVAKLVREDSTAGSSHVYFVVRNDNSASKILFQTSDETWQAYNTYGGNSLYEGTGPGKGLSAVGRAYKVSYNRPITTRGTGPEDAPFNAEYPMIRFLERNGYDVSYFTGIDAARSGAEIKEHKIYLSTGHDEYWSKQQRANVEAARDAGVSMAFFSGNEVYWKTRLENSIGGTATANRTMVAYKETHEGAKIDPSAEWTGTWRDPRFSPPSDGGNPENSLTGQLFMVNDGATGAIQVPAADGKMRFWRSTTVASLAAGATATLPQGTLGYEWDTDPDNGFRPAGSFNLSTTTVANAPVLTDYGSTFGSGTAVHRLSLYKAASGALVFGAGTVQWAWGLDANHDRGSAAASLPMQQATVNLFADMGVQPTTVMAGVTATPASTDATKPTSTITSPAAGATITPNSTVTITGTAADTGGQVGGIEVSTDGGATWHPATGRASWTYSWRATGSGAVTIKTRATDDTGNIETPGAGRTVQVGGATGACPCTLFDNATPTHPAETTDTIGVEVGTKFRATTTGTVTAIRFYKGATNTGTHVGHLWSSTGQLLATVNFTGETATGWQSAPLGTPVAITAGTTYVVSYFAPNGNYAYDASFFASQGFDNGPLHALSEAEGGGNGVYGYGGSGTFPTNSWQSTNYWVDVSFTNGAADTTPPTITDRSPASGATAVAVGTKPSATFNEAMNASTITATTVTLKTTTDGTAVPGTVSYDAVNKQAVFTPTATLAASTSYTMTVTGGASGVKDASSNALAATSTWSFTTDAPPPPGSCPCSIWASPTPAVPTATDDSNSVEVGVKFRSTVGGKVTGIRFYKGSLNTGTHTGHLWSSSGTLLGSATFSNESTTGWQTATFTTPIAVTAGTTYVASYLAPNGGYAHDSGYFTGKGADNEPLHALQSGVDGNNGVFAYGTGATFPNGSFQDTNYWVDVTFVKSTDDTTAPKVTAQSPAAGATGVAVASKPSATFDEALDPATVTATTVTLKTTTGGTAVPGAASYDALNRQVVFTPTANLANNTSYTMTVKGGASGVKDTAANPLAADSTWAFTTVATSSGDTCPCSIWSNPTPTVTSATDDTGSVELGVKFRPTVSGTVDGIRFYKGSLNTGTHTGHLWTTGGTLLGTLTFSGESATGWQSADFPTPIAVDAGTTYVASYHAPNGGYAYDSGYFTSKGVDNGPLHALQTGENGGNGVFGYGSGATFPTGSFGDTNYWVDVSFSKAGVDTKPPTIATKSPADGATGVAAAQDVTATFSENMAAATVTGTNFTLKDSGGASIAATVTYDAASRVATLNPSADLGYSKTYTASIKGGTGGVTDTAGNAMAATMTWTFTTGAAPPPPPDQGPGGPVLVMTSSTDPYSKYFAEILRSEGLNEFATQSLSTVTATTLAGYKVAVLPQQTLTAAQVSMLTTWVNGGGDLIASRPDKQLSSLLGLTDAGTTLANGYIKVNTAAAPGTGIVSDTMQYHGTADRYTLNGATAVAALYSDATTATANPAVTMRSVGANGGRAIAFTYDLSRSIIAMRQGNQAWAGQERDNQDPIRSDDLFFGNKAGDVQQDWVNLNKVDIPQADEQQRLFANAVSLASLDKQPLPRFWYFPRDEKAVVVMTGDDHAQGGTAGRWQQYEDQSPAGCDVDKWECIRATSYVFNDSPLTDAQAKTFTAAGFEVGLHLNTNCENWTPATLKTFLDNELDSWHQQFPSLPSPVTNRTHCIVWSDWATMPKQELAHGVRLDTNYYYWPPEWVGNRPGFMTGSGMPQRFADTDGTMIDVYQALTEMTDESGQSYPFTSDALLGNATGAKGYYGAFVANMHTDQDESTGSDGILASAKALGVPVISSKQLLTWLDGRNGSSFSNLAYSGGNLTFDVNVGTGADGLRGMVPVDGATGTLQSVKRGTTTLTTTTQTIKGVRYAFFDATAGSYTATYGTGTPGDTTPPTVSAVTATPAADGLSATVTWTTDEASDTKVAYGTSATALNLSATSATRVTAHSIQLTGLTAGTTYSYRVTSADAAGNATTSPATTSNPATFTTPAATVNAAPAAVAITSGSLRAGTFASLAADDGTSYQVNASLSGITETSGFYGSFTGVPKAATSISYTYDGSNSASCTQTVAAYNFTTAAWTTLDSRTVSTTKVLISADPFAGTLSQYVSGTGTTGEVRVRVQCQRTAITSHFTSADYLRLTYR